MVQVAGLSGLAQEVSAYKEPLHSRIADWFASATMIVTGLFVLLCALIFGALFIWALVVIL